MEYVNNDLVAESYQKELHQLKTCVEETHKYFKPNYDRFNKFRKFVFETSVTQPEKAVNEQKAFPTSEFNTCNAYISRLCGQFAKQEPSIEVMPADGAKDEKMAEMIEVVEGHFRHLIDEAENDGTQYNTFRDSLSGGFTQLSLCLEYLHPMSFDHIFKLRKAKYPTMCGFDPMATTPHKGDGNFSFKIFPKRKKEFKEEYPNLDIESLSYTQNIESFSWSFNNSVDDILLICEFYKKKKKKAKIVKIAKNELKLPEVMTLKEYKQAKEEWEMNADNIQQFPEIMGKPRDTILEEICRYTFIENQVLKYEKTDFKYLPDVMVDGDSVDLYDSSNGKTQLFTRPYIYHAEGAQNLKNLSTQALMNHIEDNVQHKFIVKKEAIPTEESYQRALTNYQKRRLMVVNAFMDNEPNNPIPEPIREVIIQPCPPEIVQGIQIADNIMQMVLGTFNTAQGNIGSNVAEETIIDAITESNNAALPYVVNYLLALNQIALNYIDLIPKYWVTPRTIPILDKNGERSFVRINDPDDPNSINLKYEPNALNVKIKPGVNFSIQKIRALQQIILMMKASESFNQFMNTKGLQVLIDNLEIRGSDILKELAKEYQEEQKQAQAQQMQMAQQAQMMNPMMIRAQTEKEKLQHTKENDMIQNHLKQEELQAKREQNAIQASVMIKKADAEKMRAAADMGVKVADMSHRHVKEHHELKHKINLENKQHEHNVKQSENNNKNQVK